MTNIMELKVTDLVHLNNFILLANEASEAYELIKKSFSKGFGLGNTEIEVFLVNEFDEYYGNATLTIDGIWRYHDNWTGNDWEVECTPDGIFLLYRAEYLKSKGCMTWLSEEHQHLADVACHFRDFVSKLRDKE